MRFSFIKNYVQTVRVSRGRFTARKRNMFFQEPVVIFDHQLRLHLFFKFHRYRYDDKNTRRREYVHERDIRPCERNRGNKRNERKVNRAEKRYTVGNLFKIGFRCFTRTNTLDKATVLLNTLGNVLGIELHLRIEERERKDEQAKD